MSHTSMHTLMQAYNIVLPYTSKFHQIQPEYTSYAGITYCAT